MAGTSSNIARRMELGWIDTDVHVSSYPFAILSVYYTVTFHCHLAQLPCNPTTLHWQSNFTDFFTCSIF